MVSRFWTDFFNFKLTTSQISTPFDIVVGYGPVVSDGYGCCYTLKDEEVLFVASTFLDASQFVHSIQSSLIEIEKMFS